MMITASRRGPLARFKVIDLTRVRSGPTCVRQLSDWGADVIRIEAPAALEVAAGWGGSRHGPDFQNLHRNKRCMTLNLKDRDGVAIFRKLADSADVVVENFRPDVKFRLGIDYDTLSKSNPRLVYASISGFGQDGPYAGRTGFDQIAQGMGGLMAITGEPGRGPMRAGIAISDSAAGIYCASGILTALFDQFGVAWGPIYKMNEVFADPQVQHLKMAAPVEHPTLGRINVVNQPIELTRTPSEIRSATPELGEHTDEILRELGYRGEEIADLRRRVII